MRTALQRLSVGKVLFVGLENGRAMDHWVERGPFLEVDVDELIRHETRWCLNGLVCRSVCKGRWRLGQRLGRHVGWEFALVGQFAGKCVYTISFTFIFVLFSQDHNIPV